MSRDQDMERFRPPAPTPAREMQSAMMESNLYQLLEELIGEFVLCDIIKGLERQGITTWRRFIFMDPDDLPKLTMSCNGIAIPISNHMIRIMGHIKHLIWENIENNVPEAELASTYTSEMLHE